jgi:hypothetical protein
MPGSPPPKIAPLSALLAAALVSICALSIGCGAAAPEATPEGTVSRFAGALSEGRFEEAYGLMSDAYRRRVSLEEFREHLSDNPSETRRTVRALHHRRGPAEQEAVVTYGEQQSLRLVRDSGSWRVATDVVDFYSQRTPRDALRSFVRAMERRRYDVVLRLVPEAEREHMSEERLEEAWEGEGREDIERLVANLRASLDSPIEEAGDRATMAYGERYRVLFVREGSLWRIEDPD